MLIFYPILYNGAPATMVNLNNVHYGIYCLDEVPINLRLNQLTRIKTGANLNQLRITYEPDKQMKPIEICFFSRFDRDEFLQNLVEAQLVDQAKCCYLYVPAFLLRSCCGLFRYNQLYVRKQNLKVSPAKKPSLIIKRKKKSQGDDIAPNSSCASSYSLSISSSSSFAKPSEAQSSI